MNKPVIELKSVSYTYPVSDSKVLKDVSLTIEEGKFYAVIGNNGAGKTTLCNLFRGFIPHFYKGELEGEVLLFQEPIQELNVSDLARRMGFVFQNPFIQVSGVKETVFDEIAFGLENLGVPEAEIIDRVDSIMKRLKIEHLREKSPFQLSGGQRQRVALASIVVMDADVFVIDEPTSQLDPQGTDEIFGIIKLLKEMGKTIILVEHKMNLVAEYADEVIILEEGKIVMQGKTRDVFTNPDFLQLNVLAPQVSQLYFALKDRGMTFEEAPLTLEEMLDSLRSKFMQEVKE